MHTDEVTDLENIRLSTYSQLNFYRLSLILALNILLHSGNQSGIFHCPIIRDAWLYGSLEFD